MTCGQSTLELLDALETQASLLDGVRSAPAKPNWREELIRQADQQRLAAFESWRRHLIQPSELSIQQTGNCIAIQYGSMVRVVPSSMLRTPRHARFIAEILWDGEHRRPKFENYAEAWNEARPACVERLARDIVEWVAQDVVRLAR